MRLFSWFNSTDQLEGLMIFVGLLGLLIEFGVSLKGVIKAKKDPEEGHAARPVVYLETFALIAAIFAIIEALLGWRLVVLYRRESRETERRILGIDPMNRPIENIAAEIELNVLTNGFRFDRDRRPFTLVRIGTQTGSVTNDWLLQFMAFFDGWSPSDSNGVATIWLRSPPQDAHGMFWNFSHGGAPAALNEVDAVAFSPAEIDSARYVIGGNVRLLVNGGSATKEFEIPPQTNPASWSVTIFKTNGTFTTIPYEYPWLRRPSSK